MLHTGLRIRGLAWRSPRVNGAFGWRVLCSFLFVLSILLSTHPGIARASTDAYVSTDALYLRSDPSVNSEIVNEMLWGDYVAIIDGPTDDGWYFVDFDGQQGWAYGDYLSIGAAPSSDSGATAVGGSGDTVWVATDALNVRSDPDADGWILGTAGQGDQFQVVGDPVAGYYPVSYGDVTGWVLGSYLSWSAVGSGPERWISVDRSSTTVSLMVGDTAIATYVASMGFDQSADGYYSTALGTYYVYVKNASLTYTKFAKGYITYWVGFDEERENGFHSWLLDANGYFLDGGDGETGGCVSLEPELAAAVYDFSTYGMRVEVHW
jgi:uncharacterized protein YgiM (DUF1202 family)